MPQISKKGNAIPASPIRKLVPFADAAKAKGIKVYHLNIGQPDIETPPHALHALKEADIPVIEYTASGGNPALKEKLARYYRNIGIELTDQEILITSGGSEAILFAFLSTLNEGDEIIIPEPYYANYTTCATLAGVEVKTVTSTIENNFALPPIAEIEQLITPKTKGIVIINPNNPTGYLYSQKELEELAKIVKKYNLYLYSDEVYREYCYDGAPHYSVMNLPGIEQNVVLFESMSKRYSACGIRIGAIVTRNQQVLATALKIAMSRLCPPALGQIVAEAALDTPDTYFAEMNHTYRERRDFMVEALNRIPGVICPTPQGAFYAIVRLPVDDADRFAQWLLEDFSYKNQTVMVAPASGFYGTPGKGKDEVRIAYVLNISDLKNAMEILAVALKEYPGAKQA
ncbi:MAG: pyridoxal phosphate-dependent aminotransferase [Culturomica sp.]|jgi:aspartate aminotransferase|nr:pyridoxal phosphate-dependent aminotransferase [Culturomica sp.]